MKRIYPHPLPISPEGHAAFISHCLRRKEVLGDKANEG